MEEIIYNPNFQNAYNYSVHSYAFFIMKYYDKKGVISSFRKMRYVEQPLCTSNC